MLPTPAFLRLALCISSLSPLASAWPSWLPDVDSLVVRQDNGDGESSSVAERTTESTITATVASRTRETDTATTSASRSDDGDLNTAKPETNSGRTKTPSESTRTSYDQNDYPAGVEMVTPDPIQVASALYKIGDNIEWAWNYTSLQATPTAIDVLLSCSAASETWTLTANMTFETDVSYIWESKDTDEEGPPLGTEMYTLIIKDSEAEVSDLPEPGYLNSYQGFTFGLYHPQPYTPLPEWECVGCNAAAGGMDVKAVKLAVAMAFLTICSFTWFATGFGLA